MQKLIYMALLPLLINSATSSDYMSNPDAEMESKLSHDIEFLLRSTDDSPTQTDDNFTPKSSIYSSIATDSSYSLDFDDLTSFVTWGKKDRDTPAEEVLAINCEEYPLFMSCARLLSPYMKNHRSSYTKEEKIIFNQAVAQIAEAFLSILPTERYEITQKLNILAMFKSEMTFVKIKGKGKKKTQVEVKCTLAERFRIGKNRRNPMQMQCAQIEGKMVTDEQATLALYEEWKEEGVLDQKVRSCKWRLKSKGFNKYQWPDNELIELLTIRINMPHIVKASTYNEDKIAKFCKRVRKKGKRKSQYIKNTATPQLTQQWRSRGVLNEAITECSRITAEARLWLE